MKIGKLVPVDLREVWRLEEQDFSKWLSENLDALIDAIDMELELVDVEKKVGDSNFTIDVLAEADNGEQVVIENQLEKTNHTHLGQLLTYASNIGAKTAIWITKEARQEHVNAINFLNEAKVLRFYLVEVAVYKIEDSKPAPFFSVICKPSKESVEIGQAKKEVAESIEANHRRRAKADTIIVPAKKEGFERVFMGENSWYSIRIHADRLEQLKYIASYQVAPISAITHLAKIKSIVPAPDDENKFKIIFEGPAKEIRNIPVGDHSKVQRPAYCEFRKLDTAETLDDLLRADEYFDENAA